MGEGEDMEMDWRWTTDRLKMGDGRSNSRSRTSAVRARCDICRSKNASNDWHWLFMQCRGRASLDVQMSLIFSLIT